MQSTALTPVVRHYRFGLLQPHYQGAELRKCKHVSSPCLWATCVLTPHLAAGQDGPLGAGVYPLATCSGACGAAGRFWQVIGVRAQAVQPGGPAGVESGEHEHQGHCIVGVTCR